MVVLFPQEDVLILRQEKEEVSGIQRVGLSVYGMIELSFEQVEDLKKGMVVQDVVAIDRQLRIKREGRRGQPIVEMNEICIHRLSIV